MTQYLEGRRGRFWQVPPNGSVAAQWACPVAEAVGFALGLPGLGRGAFALPFLEGLAGLEDRWALRGAFPRPDLAARLAGFRDAAFFGLGGLMRTCGAIPGRP